MIDKLKYLCLHPWIKANDLTYCLNHKSLLLFYFSCLQVASSFPGSCASSSSSSSSSPPSCRLMDGNAALPGAERVNVVNGRLRGYGILQGSFALSIWAIPVNLGLKRNCAESRYRNPASPERHRRSTVGWSRISRYSPASLLNQTFRTSEFV